MPCGLPVIGSSTHHQRHGRAEARQRHERTLPYRFDGLPLDRDLARPIGLNADNCRERESMPIGRECA
jgi:hypothetical protein